MKITIRNFYHKYKAGLTALFFGLYSVSDCWQYLFSGSSRAIICSIILIILATLSTYWLISYYDQFDTSKATWKQLFSAAGILFLCIFLIFIAPSLFRLIF